MTASRRTAAALGALLLLGLTGCAGARAPRADSSATPTGTTTPTARPTPRSPLPLPSVPTTRLPVQPGSPSGSAASAPAGLDLSVTLGDCNYVPHGAIDGSDIVNVGVHLVVTGAADFGRLVRVRLTSDTGWSTSVQASAGREGLTFLAVSLRENDFGRTHRTTVEVDPDREVAERDERNNTLRVLVALPSPRPESSIDPLPCA